MAYTAPARFRSLGATLGCLALYSSARQAFHAEPLATVGTFGTSAAAALRNAQAIAHGQRLSAAALWTSSEGAVIQRAIGILMSRRGGSADDALASLRDLSQRRNVKLVALAQLIVDEAMRRARRRATTK